MSHVLERTTLRRQRIMLFVVIMRDTTLLWYKAYHANIVAAKHRDCRTCWCSFTLLFEDFVVQTSSPQRVIRHIVVVHHNDHAICIEHAVYCSCRYRSINLHPSLKYPQHVEFEYSDATLNTLYLGASWLSRYSTRPKMVSWSRARILPAIHNLMLSYSKSHEKKIASNQKDKYVMRHLILD
jgi:hypothetical protein